MNGVLSHDAALVKLLGRGQYMKGTGHILLFLSCVAAACWVACAGPSWQQPSHAPRHWQPVRTAGSWWCVPPAAHHPTVSPSTPYVARYGVMPTTTTTSQSPITRYLGAQNDLLVWWFILCCLRRGTKPISTPHDSQRHFGLSEIGTCDHLHASPKLYDCATGADS